MRLRPWMGMRSRCARAVLGLLLALGCTGGGEAVDLGATTSHESTTDGAPTTALQDDTTTAAAEAAGTTGTTGATSASNAESSTGLPSGTFGPVP